MALLYYWERGQFLKDNSGVLDASDLDLSQGSDALGNAAAGERLWAFTRDCENRYVLAAQLRVDRIVERGSPLGRYTALAKPSTTVRYRLVNPAIDFEPTVRGLAIDNTATILGQNFTGHSAVRTISDADDGLVDSFAKALKLATPGLKWRPSKC